MKPLSLPRLSAPTLSVRDRRTVLVGASIVVIAAVFRGTPAWLDWRREALASVAELHVELARAQEDVRQMASTRKQLSDAIRRISPLEHKAFIAEPAASGSAQLVILVRLAARTAGVDLQAVRVLADSVIQFPLGIAAVAVEGQTDIRGLAVLLHFLESGERFVSIREFTIKQLQPGSPGSVPESLHFSLRVDGMFLQPQEKISE